MITFKIKYINIMWSMFITHSKTEHTESTTQYKHNSNSDIVGIANITNTYFINS